MRKSDFFRFAVFAILALTIGFVFAAHLPQIVESESEDFNVIKTRESSDFLGTLLSSPSPTPEISHILVGAYYDVQNFPSAKLLLNNKDSVAREVLATLFSPDGQIAEIPPVQVEAQSFRLIDLREWANLGGTDFNRGSIKLIHAGKDLVLGTQIYLEDIEHSLSFEEKLSEIGTYDSRRLEGVWFQPSNQTESNIVITNTSDQLLNVATTLSRRPHVLSIPKTFILQPHEVRLVNLRETFGNAFANSDAVGISITHDGTPSALLARAMVSETAKGYSTVVTLSNPNAAKSNQLHGAGLRLGSINGDRLSPAVVLRNTSEANQTVNVSIPYTLTTGTTNILTLAPVNLRGNEIKTISFDDLSQPAEQGILETAGIEIRNLAENGVIIAQMQSISKSRTQSFRTLLWDPPAQRSPTGGYPWLIEGNSATNAYIKNVTDDVRYYVSYLTWENGGMYMIGIRQIAPHQTVKIDVKKLRDEQIPDEEGRIIPNDMYKGQIQWTAKTHGPAPSPTSNDIPLVGQMEQTDTVSGISSSYFCQNCCEDEAYGSIGPTNIQIDVGRSIQYQSYAVGYNCYDGSYKYETTESAAWTSSSTDVARIIGAGMVETIAVGSTNIKAEFEVTDHEVNEPCPGGGGTYLLENQLSFFEKNYENKKRDNRTNLIPGPCACLCFSRQVSTDTQLTVYPGILKIQYQEPGTSNYVDITNTLYVLKGTPINFKAIPNPTSSTFPSGQPTWSGTSGVTGTGQTKSVTFNTISSSMTDYKTVIVKSAIYAVPKTVNVVVYELTGTLIPQDNFTGRSQINYGVSELVDLNFTTMPSLTINETGNLVWKIISGNGVLQNVTTNGINSYRAPVAPSTEVLKIEIIGGPSKGLGSSYTKTVVAPNGASTRLGPPPNVAHLIGTCSVTVKMDVYLTPKDVSFEQIVFIEDMPPGAIGVGLGFYAFLNNNRHDPSSFWDVGPGNINDGCFVFQDRFGNLPGTGYPPVGNPPQCTPGDFRWVIPWYYQVTLSTPPVYFMTATHHQYTIPPDEAWIEKAGTGPIKRIISDMTTNFP